MDNLEELKRKYHEGYRCIFREQNDGFTIHLKNFEEEKLHTVFSNENMEIGAMENFLEDIEDYVKVTGHDSFCTQKESDIIVEKEEKTE
ncbi:hypothetical protein AN639_04170 [Candidatus Epulonipiscium fishelsonii]|uniref:Uncharacterized protein n=1 Tax=Candidatus Epulonipiscium fishelsonii TaxID=77094 RepID=A0ACC8X9T6_9FIRM|nr:hypothetical protein AN396_09660 [Epulopiscium sp. SCG-B11WGA-EpuloA1]ONI40914.1 hypothetical protein AN639_04170 [Epulopiscium sp. SCG-B05WGA-EpuloA1]